MKLVNYHNSSANNQLSSLDALLGLSSAGVSPIMDIVSRLSNVPWDRVLEARGVPSLFEDDDNFYVQMELPGVKKDHLGIELTGNQLDVTVKTGEEGAETRSVTVPDGVDPARVSAKLEDGILTVTLGKHEAQKPRVIKVK